MTNYKEAQKKNCKFCKATQYECTCHEYKKTFNTIYSLKNANASSDAEEDYLKKLREIIESEFDEIPELLPLDTSEDNEDVPDLLELSATKTGKMPTSQYEENDENGKIQELNEETDEKKSTESENVKVLVIESQSEEQLNEETQAVESEDKLKSENSEDKPEKKLLETKNIKTEEMVVSETKNSVKSQTEDISKILTETELTAANNVAIPQKTENVPETPTDKTQDENMALPERCDDKDNKEDGKDTALEQKTLENQEEEESNLSSNVFKPKIEVDMTDENEITESASTVNHNDYDDKIDENDSKKLGIFKFTAKGSGSEIKIPKSPVKNSKTKATKSMINGTVNFSITADQIPKPLNFNLAAQLPLGKTDSPQNDDNNSTAVTDKKEEEETSKINRENETGGNSETSDVPESKPLRRCAKCDTEEPHFKAFKKCQK